jgi:hypothetical protein
MKFSMTTASFCVGLVLLMGAGCRKNDYRVLEFRVPEMKNEACADIVRKAIHGSERIKIGKAPAKNAKETTSRKSARERAISKLDIDIDVETRTVKFWYDSIITGQKNIEYRIAAAGFRVETQSRGEPIVIPADPKAQAALPANCR